MENAGLRGVRRSTQMTPRHPEGPGGVSSGSGAYPLSAFPTQVWVAQGGAPSPRGLCISELQLQVWTDHPFSLSSLLGFFNELHT